MALRGWSALAQAAALLVLVGAATLWLSGPPSRAATAPVKSGISLERALGDVSALSREPGQTGSEGNASRRRYILEQLARVGVSAEVQSTDSVVSLLGRVIAARVHNVVARIAGRDPGPALLLSAHYDAVPNSPGASDDAAGVATLLETARVLRAGPVLGRDVILLFTDGEELGLLGADAFVSEHPLAKRVGWALNFEARGSSGASAMYETSLPNAQLLTSFARAAPRPIANSLISSLSRALPNDTDFTLLRRAGIPGYAFAFADGFEDYHRATDSVERLDPRSLAHHLSYAVALTRELAEAGRAADIGPDNDVYFDVLGRWLVSYSERAARVLGLLPLVLGVGAWRAGRRRGVVTASGVGWGVLGCLLSVVVAVGAALLLEVLLARALPFERRVAWASGLLLAHLGFALLACVELYRRLLRRASGVELELGSLLVGALFATALCSAAPGMSYAPLGAVVPALCGWWWRHAAAPTAAAARASWLAALALVPAVFFIVSVGYAFFVLMGTQLPAVSALAVGWGAGLLLPWSAALWQPRWRRVQLGLGTLAVSVATGACVLGFVRPAPPVFTDLHYAYDLGTQRARWSVSSGLGQPALARLLRGAPPPKRPLPGSLLKLTAREPLADGRYRLSLVLTPAAGTRCVTLTQLGGGRIASARLNGRAPHPNVRFNPELDKKLWQLVTGQHLTDAFNLGYCSGSSEPVQLELNTVGPSLFVAITDAHDGIPPELLELPRLGPELHYDLNGNRTLIEHRVQL